MNRPLNPGGLARCRFHLTAIVVTILTVGCARYRVAEIDTTTARGFSWDGRVRITERIIEEMNLFAPREERTEITRIELLGEGDRSIVIRPLDDLRGDDPYACVQDVGSPPDQYLVPLRKQVSEYERAWESMLALENLREGSPELKARQKAWNEAIAKYERVNAHIQKREFGKMSGAQLAFASAFLAMQLESKYELDERTLVRVRIEDGSLLTVTVEDRDGNVLHRYCPEELAVTQAEDR
jgi:hypothetical protein